MQLCQLNWFPIFHHDSELTVYTHNNCHLSLSSVFSLFVIYMIAHHSPESCDVESKFTHSIFCDFFSKHTLLWDRFFSIYSSSTILSNAILLCVISVLLSLLWCVRGSLIKHCWHAVKCSLAGRTTTPLISADGMLCVDRMKTNKTKPRLFCVPNIFSATSWSIWYASCTTACLCAITPL